MNKIFLKKYTIKTPEVYSELIWINNKNNLVFNLSYPSNPVLDVELMILHEKNIGESINILSNYIRKNGYPKNVMNKLKQFLEWMLKVQSHATTNHHCYQ